MRKMQPLRVGVIGCGRIATTAHIPNYVRSGATVAAIADVDQNRLREVGERYSISRRYLDHRDLLKEADLEAVSICTPPASHADVAVEAANARKHILCEKPIATAVAAAQEMIGAARDAGVILMVGHNLRFLPNHERTKRLIDQNRIGKPLFARAQWVASPEEGSQWHSKSGVLLDAGTHLADLMRWIFKEVEDASAMADGGQGSEKKATIALRFKSGLIGQINAIYAPLHRLEALSGLRVLEIIGERGKIVSDLFGPSLRYYADDSLMCRLRGELNITPKTDPRNPTAALVYSYRREIEAFVRSAQKGTTPPITGEDGMEALRIVMARRDP